MPDAYLKIPGWFAPPEAAFYREQVARAQGPAHFVEVGAWQGRSAAAMAEAIRDSGKLIRFDSVDTWRGSQYGSHPGMVAEIEAGGSGLRKEYEVNLRGYGLWRYVNPVTGDSPTVAATYADESLDFVFIDGDHRADAVEDDCRAWWPKLKPGGLLAGHDAQNPMVWEGIRRFIHADAWDQFGTVNGAVWAVPRHPSLILGYAERASPPATTLTIPARSPGCELWRPYILRGCRDAGIECREVERLEAESYFLPKGQTRQTDQPYHVAAFEVDGRRVWFDFSDFTDWAPELPAAVLQQTRQLGYFKKQCPGDERSRPWVRPAGQYIPRCEEYLALLPELREAGHNLFPGTAHFSNIDERNNPPLRRQLVEHLAHREAETGEGWQFGLWRFRDRPDPPLGTLREPLTYHHHLRRVAHSSLVFALPGVGGDSTRMHAETLGIGSCLVTLKTEQVWPGNWRGCWAEMERDLSDLDEVVDRLLADEEERERLARLGMWYWQTNLAPAPYVRRLAICARTSG